MNHDMKAAFYQAMMQIPQVSTDSQDTLSQWAELFDWREMSQSSTTLPRTAFYNLMLLHDFILGSTYPNRLL